MNTKEELQMAAWDLIIEDAEMYANIIKADSKLTVKNVNDIAESIELVLSIIREECNDEEYSYL